MTVAVKKALPAALDDIQARELCRRFAIPFPPYAVGQTLREAKQSIDAVGYPVVLKLKAKDLLHRSDMGGIALNVHSDEDLAREFQRLKAAAANSGHEFEGVLIDRQMPAGLEMIVGAIRDATFGPAVMVGIGGIYVEILRDVVYRMCPCSASEALAMLEELKGISLLNGARGQPAADKTALADIIVQASKLMLSDEKIAEVDLNPVIAYSKGAIAVDAKILYCVNAP